MTKNDRNIHENIKEREWDQNSKLHEKSKIWDYKLDSSLDCPHNQGTLHDNVKIVA